MAQLTVLDVSILIAALNPHDAHAPDARRIIATGDALVVSTLTLAESLVGAARIGRLAAARQRIAELAIREIPFTDGSAVALAQLRAQTGLKTPDCCVLHAAVLSGADAIATRDTLLRTRAAEQGFRTP